MLYHFLYPLSEFFSPFNLFRYVTFRTGMAALIALLLSLFIGRPLIAMLRERTGMVIRKLTPERHKAKLGTPSMGGILILIAVFTSVLFTARLDNINVWLCLGVFFSYALIGFIDDYLKVSRKDGKGIASRFKLYAQMIIGLSVALYLVFANPNTYVFGDSAVEMTNTAVTVPFLSYFSLELGLVLYLLFAVIVMTGSSNAVNVTDGLDGLAIGLTFIVSAAFAGLVYLSGHAGIAGYLKIQFIPGIEEVAVFCGALTGASLGFLWFNSHPASVFMGDTGSLAIGGVLGLISLLLKHELLLVIVGGVFVAEALSVMIQVGSFKLRKKRVFLMAPLHHHFEMKGWHENKIITRFWTIGILLALVALASLKVR